MTIYFVGSSVSDFDEFSSSASAFDDDTSPNPSIDAAGAVNTEASILRNLDTTVTGALYMSFIIARWIPQGIGADFSLSNQPDESTVSLWDGEGNNIFFGGYNINTGNFEGRVQLRDGSSEDLTIFPGSLIGVGEKFTIRIEPGVGISFYHDSDLKYSYSGNVGNSLSTTNGVGKIGVGNGDFGSAVGFEKIIVADFDTRFADVDFVVVNTTPSTDTSSGGDPTLIPTIVDARNTSEYEANNLLNFDADGEKVIYPENDTITIREGYEIAGIVMTHSATRTASSPVPTLTPIVEVSGTEYTGSTTTLTEATKYIQTQFTTNPATGVAWTESDLEGVGYGFSLNS